jgi:hypothetical protein
MDALMRAAQLRREADDEGMSNPQQVTQYLVEHRIDMV